MEWLGFFWFEEVIQLVQITSSMENMPLIQILYIFLIYNLIKRLFIRFVQDAPILHF